MLNCRRAPVLVTLAFSLLVAFPPPAAADTVMKLASATVDDVQHEWQRLFAAALHRRLGERVRTEIHPASALGPIPEMVSGVARGTIESFITPTAFLTEIEPGLAIFDMPGLFSSPAHVRAVLDDPAYRDRLERMSLARGLRVIGATYNSPTVALFRRRVATLAAIQGLKVRTFTSPLQVEPIKAIGAVPVPLALSEVAPRLRAGEIDGALAGMPILTAFDYHEVARFVLDLEVAHIVSVAVVNEAWLQAQPEEIREAIRAAGREAERQAHGWGVENLKRAEAAWAANAGEVARLPAAEQAEMARVFASVAARLLERDPAVKAEFLALKAVVEAKAPK